MVVAEKSSSKNMIRLSRRHRRPLSRELTLQTLANARLSRNIDCRTATREELVLCASGLAGFMIRRWDPPCSHDDCYQEMMMAAAEAAEEYDPTRAKWSTYVYQKMRWAMGRYMVWASCTKRLFLDEAQSVDERTIVPADPAAAVEDAALTVRRVLSLLTPKEAWLIRTFYGIDVPRRTLREIAEILGVTKEAVRQQRLRAERNARRQSRLHGEE